MKTIFISLLALAGCTTYNPPSVIPAPVEPETYLERYEFRQGFNGVEVSVGIPFLSWVPVVGPYLEDMIQFRAGVRQDVLVPVMRESIYEHEARMAAHGCAGIRLVPSGVLEHERPWLCGREGRAPGVRR